MVGQIFLYYLALYTDPVVPRIASQVYQNKGSWLCVLKVQDLRVFTVLGPVSQNRFIKTDYKMVEVSCTASYGNLQFAGTFESLRQNGLMLHILIKWAAGSQVKEQKNSFCIELVD